MRNAFAAAMTELAGENEKVVLLSGDIGNRLFDDFKAKYPDRFLNCGVAEANMTGMAAGMAATGLRPVTYTITAFNTVRCLEQIRVDLCYHGLPVVVVGVGGGMSYAELGGTHHACEDISLLRSLPGMRVVCPADATEARLAVRAALQEDGPVYIRLGKKGEPAIHTSDPDFQIGRGITLRSGSNVALLSTGNMVKSTLECSDLLHDAGISAEVVNLHTVKPLDTPLLSDLTARFSTLVTIEEHSVIGGLGSAVAEWFADTNCQGVRLLRIGTPDSFLHESGKQAYARERLGLTPKAITKKIQNALSN